VTSDSFATVKLRTMEAFGARLEVLPSPDGIRPDLIPRMIEPADVDEVVPVSTGAAFAMVRRPPRVEGLWSGPSTGANLACALELARRLGPGKRVVTTLVDSGLKYLRGNLYSKWSPP
jgi:cysteine synthase A